MGALDEVRYLATSGIHRLLHHVVHCLYLRGIYSIEINQLLCKYETMKSVQQH